MAYRYSFIDPFASALSDTIASTVLSPALPELQAYVSNIVGTAGYSWSEAAAEDAPAEEYAEHADEESYEGDVLGTHELLAMCTEDELNMHWDQQKKLIRQTPYRLHGRPPKLRHMLHQRRLRQRNYKQLLLLPP